MSKTRPHTASHPFTTLAVSALTGALLLAPLMAHSTSSAAPAKAAPTKTVRADEPDAAPWIKYRSRKGQVIWVRYYAKMDEGLEKEYADLRRNGRIIKMSLVGGERANERAYGDGKRLTLVSYGGGDRVMITDGRTRVTYGP